MSTYAKALLWGLVILAVAILGQAGVIAEDTTRTLLIVLPALAFVTLRSRSCCAFPPRGKA